MVDRCNCNDCPLNMISETGAIFCYNCPVGTYNTSNITQPCQNCPIGFKSETIGKGADALLTCKPCDVGEYQSEKGKL